MEVNKRKTKCMCMNDRTYNGTVKMQGEEVTKVDDFTYMG